MTNPLIAQQPDRAAVLSRAVFGAAERLAVNQATLAQILGVSPATVSRMANGQHTLREHSKEWELAALFVRLYRGLDAIAASDERTLRGWMWNPNGDLRAVPGTLITQVSGLVETLNYVDAARARI